MSSALRHSAALAAFLFASGAGAQVRRPTPPTTARPTPSRPATTRQATAAAAPAADSTLVATGVVYDSLARAPLAGATVQLVSILQRDRVWTATTAADGSWRIAGVPAGRYLAGFVHPSLDVVGIESPVHAVDILPGRTTVDLSIPGSARLFAALCPNVSSDSVGALIGRVHDADTDTPIGGARVVVTWSETTIINGSVRALPRRMPVTARPDGGYLLCGLPSDVLVASADAPGRATGLVEVRVPYRGMERRDFSLGDSASAVSVAAAPDSTARGEPAGHVLRGTSRLTGRVRARDGKPLANARLYVQGTSVIGATQEDGTFALSGLPAGTYSLDVRAIGFQPRSVGVDLASGRTATASVTLDASSTQTLGTVTVYGKRSRSARNLDGFLQRSKNGFGRYTTAEDIEKMSAINFTDVLRRTPGIQVSPGRGFGNVVRGRGGCTPAIVLDGMPIQGGADDIDSFVRPSEVAGVEVYSGMGGAPAEFGGMNGCGMVLVWTKR